MEHQKIINLLDNTPNQPSKFRTKNWVENNYSRGTYNTNSQIKFKTSMFMSSLWDYNDAYILVKETITVQNMGRNNANNANKKVMFKNSAPFTYCEINNRQIDNAGDIDVIMLIYKLIEYSDNYSKTLGNLCQYYWDELAFTKTGAVGNFADSSVSFKFKQKITA